MRPPEDAVAASTMTGTSLPVAGEATLRAYTRSLLRSIPSILAQPRSRLTTIQGSIPHPYNRPKGCPFHPRCPDFMPGTCDKGFPATAGHGTDHEVACFLYVPDDAVAEPA